MQFKNKKFAVRELFDFYRIYIYTIKNRINFLFNISLIKLEQTF